MARTNVCIDVRSFAGWIGLILFAEILGSVCFKSGISTIERRFNLSSTTTALLSSSFQIGSMPVLLLVSYFGSRYHRPRSIAAGCLLMGVGFMLVAMPQFVGDRYEFLDISSNDTSPSDGRQATCEKSTSNVSTFDCKQSDVTGSDQLYLFILIGMIVCGIGSTPVQPLGISYIDDHSSKHNAAFLIGIVSSVGLAAPAVGFVVGAVTLKLWVDIGWVDTSEIEITPVHPGWVGAWWIGIIVGSVAVLVAGFPLWFFPKELKKTKEMEEEEEEDSKEEKDLFSSERVSPSLKVEAGNLLTAFKRLLTNSRYLLVVTMITFQAFRIAGISVFSIKYYEVVFGKSASTGSFLIGAINLPVLVVGTIAGSYIVKRWKLNNLGITRLIMFSFIGSLLVSFPTLFVGCETIATAGLTAPYPVSEDSSLPSLINVCNENCLCDANIYTPVCGPDGITYISPCHAGCLDFTTDLNGRNKNYTNCGCVDDVMSNQTVTVGRCLNSNCEDLLWVVIGLETVESLLAGLHVTPNLLLLMRTLQTADKAFGIGMAYFTFRLLAFIPGPVIFGYLIDQTCLHWTRKPCGEHSYCSVFDSDRYRYTFLGLTLCVQLCAGCTILVYYFKYAKRDAPSESDGKSIVKSEWKAKPGSLQRNPQAAKEDRPMLYVNHKAMVESNV